MFEAWRYALPHALSAHHKRRFEQHDDNRRLQCAIGQFEATMEFIAAVALADLMSTLAAERLSECSAIAWTFNAAGPGKLMSLVDTIAQQMARDGRRPFVAGLTNLADRRSPARVSVDALIEVRNRVTHDLRLPTPAQAAQSWRGIEETFAVFESAIGHAFSEHLLGWADSPRRLGDGYQYAFYPMRGAYRVNDLVWLRGATSLPDRVPLLLSVDRSEALTLDPLLQWVEPRSVAYADAGEHRCVVLSSIDGSKEAPTFRFRDPVDHCTVQYNAEALRHALKARTADAALQRPRRHATGFDPDSVAKTRPPMMGPTLLRETYRFHGMIGRGASGTVWAASDRRNRPCAIKILDQRLVNDPNARRRFDREYSILTTIHHEGIVRCRRLDHDAQGAPYLEMELVEGQSLDRYMEASGPVAPPDAVAFVLDLLDAVEVAHNNGVYHRDIGPRNVLRRPSGRPCLIDFGVASVVDGTRLTRHGIGTDRFSAPEQLAGSQATPAADVYSVGRLLQALLHGGDPDQPSMPVSIPPDLAGVIRRATEAHPTKRYPTAVQMREALLSAMRDPPQPPEPPTPPPGTTMTPTADSVRASSRRLRLWFDGSFQPFLQRWDSVERAASLSQRLQRVDELVERCGEEQAFCFLGASGVGKSTLINALAARNHTVLPHGGVGPLTAQATVVRTSATRTIKVRYAEPQKLDQVRFALESQIERSIGASAVPAPQAAESAADELGESRIELLRRQAMLLVTGEQFLSDRPEPSLRYLAQALRRALGSEPRWDEDLSPEDLKRVERVREALGYARRGEDYEPDFSNDPVAFRREVSLHAKGHLAPLILQLEVGWPSEDVETGMALVDLPGLGVAGDSYRSVADEWVRVHARAVVLVVDRAGVTEAVARLLRTSGFWGRLHHFAGDLSEVPSLLITMVKADEVATANRRQEQETLGKGAARSWVQHLEAVRQEAEGVIRDQIRNQLRALVTEEDQGEMSGERLQIVDALLQRVQVHTVVATEYQALFDDDEETRPKIRDAEESGIPGLNRSLALIAAGRRGSLVERAEQEVREFESSARAEISVIRSRWEEDVRASEEVEKLSVALGDFLAPLRSQLDVRRGAFRNYLRETVPAQVELRSREAAHEAEKQIRSYLRKLGVGDWSYRTLQAAVRRGGTFHGSKRVDFPEDFSERLEEQIAVVWSKQLLTPMRSETRNLGKAYEQTVAVIADWAKQQGARARPQAVERLSEQLSSEARNLAAVGGDAVEDIRNAVTRELHEVVRDAVNSRCESFVAKGKDVGAGVKVRIIDLLFEDLVPTAVEAARLSATELLRRQSGRVSNAVEEALKSLPDPVEGARELVLAQAERKAAREQAKARDGVLSALTDLRETLSSAPA